MGVETPAQAALMAAVPARLRVLSAQRQLHQRKLRQMRHFVHRAVLSREQAVQACMLFDCCAALVT
jgi:hypothetical protein